MRVKAEENTRKLTLGKVSTTSHTPAMFSDDSIDIDSQHGLTGNAPIQNGPSIQLPRPSIKGNKIVLSLLELADSEPTHNTEDDEVAIYN